jgi:Tfp pilus assembly protein PilF
LNHVRLGFSYLFQSESGRENRGQEALDEFRTALELSPTSSAARVGMGIFYCNERSANRAKLAFLAALRSDPNNVLAREYLGQLYQSDLHDPQRGLSYEVDIPNLVPEYADIFYHIGSLLDDLAQPDAALKYVRQGVGLDTGHVGEAGRHGYVLIAQISIRERKFDEAKRALHAAIDADADALFAQKLLSKIENGDYDQKKTDTDKS